MIGYLYRFGAWLMHLFMVHVEVQVGALLMHLFMVHVDYRLFGTDWCMVDALVYGIDLLQVDWYRFTTVYLIVIV